MKKEYLAAVSAGPDSMAMLDIYKKSIVAVCHVNYHDRNDTDNDQRILEEYCKKNNIELYILDVKKEMMESIKSNNLQTKYRIIRYEYFLEIANILNIKKILIGHNRDDHIETAFMQMMKNSKTLFLGLKQESMYKDLCLCRPLLDIRKKTLEIYCNKQKLQYADDWTNRKNIYRRNVVRKMLASMSKIEKMKLENFIDDYNLKNKDNLFLINKAYTNWKELKFNISYFISMDDFIKENLIYNFLSDNSISKISEDKIKGITSFIISHKNNKKFRLTSNVFLRIENNCLLIDKI